MSIAKLFLVSGYSGAGKTTLVKAALAQIPSLRYLKTITTRLPRQQEIDSPSTEYEFVSPAEYQRRRQASPKWDHTEFGGQSYGVDVVWANSLLSKGSHLICCVAPVEEIAQEMIQVYAVPPTLIWVDTPLEVAASRLLNDPDKARSKRQEHNLKNLADITFTPSGNLEQDKSSFVQLLTQLKDAARKQLISTVSQELEQT